MRTYQDAAQIAEQSKDKNVVLIGSSFIGKSTVFRLHFSGLEQISQCTPPPPLCLVMEIASYLNGKCKSLSIISKSDTPFANTLGAEIGQQIKKVMLKFKHVTKTYYSFFWPHQLYLSKNIAFHVTPQVDFVIENKAITKVTFESTQLEADVCIIGIGRCPYGRKGVLSLSLLSHFRQHPKYSILGRF